MYDKGQQMIATESTFPRVAKYVGLAAAGVVCLGLVVQPSGANTNIHQRRRLQGGNTEFNFRMPMEWAYEKYVFNPAEKSYLDDWWEPKWKTNSLNDYVSVGAKALEKAKGNKLRGVDELFSKFDVDQSGYLTGSEYLEAKAATNYFTNVNYLAPDDKNPMTAEKLKTDLETIALKKDKGFFKDNDEFDKDVDLFFNYYNRNGDDKIDGKEYEPLSDFIKNIYSNPREGLTYFNKQVTHIKNEFKADFDGELIDGKVNKYQLEDFLTEHKIIVEADDSKKFAQYFFDVYDTTGGKDDAYADKHPDGGLDVYEWVQLLSEQKDFNVLPTDEDVDVTWNDQVAAGWNTGKMGFKKLLNGDWREISLEEWIAIGFAIVFGIVFVALLVLLVKCCCARHKHTSYIAVSKVITFGTAAAATTAYTLKSDTIKVYENPGCCGLCGVEIGEVDQIQTDRGELSLEQYNNKTIDNTFSDVEKENKRQDKIWLRFTKNKVKGTKDNWYGIKDNFYFKKEDLEEIIAPDEVSLEQPAADGSKGSTLVVDRRRLVSSPISVLAGGEAGAVPSLSSLEESRLPEIAIGSAVVLIFGLLCYKAYNLYRSVAKKSSSEAGDSSVTQSV